MWKHAAIAIRMVLVTVVITGVLYPLVMTGLAQALFPKQANGSLVRKGNLVIGSQLIGQQFTRPEYFHPRPSAAGKGYDAAASGGSNLGPTSRGLAKAIAASVREAVKENPGLHRGRIPVDMVTASGSGLDPDISVANAYSQVARVAAARGMPVERVRGIVRRGVTGRQFGILGERRVNVLAVNLALDAASGERH